MSEDLGRRIDLLAGELRDLVRWLKEDQARRLKVIEDAITVTRKELAGHAGEIADLRIASHDHGQRIAALEAAGEA